jgi:hypothetical protein
MIENPKIPKLRSSNGTYSALEILQAVLICFILYFGKTFSSQFSLLISFILFRFVNGWSKGINKMGAIITSLLLLVSFIAIIVYLLFANK